MKTHEYMLGQKLLYKVWGSMKQRCTNPLDTAWLWYGAKGVSVCEEWQSYRSFYEWATSNGYEKGKSIDRIDSNGNYEPSNCRWISAGENSRRANESRRSAGGYRVTKEIASFIKKSVASGSHSCGELAIMFGVSRASITNITTGKTWSDAEPVGSVAKRKQLYRKLSDDTKERISILIEIGDSAQCIADTLGVSVGVVRGAMSRMTGATA